MVCPADDGPKEKATRYLDLLRAERSGLSLGTDPSPEAASSNSASSDNPVPPRHERRRYARYTCSGSVELRKEWSTVNSWGTFTDISLSGCYIEMQATFPPETRMQLVLELEGVRVCTKAVVRVTYPFLGLGLAFTEMSKEDNARLHEMISKLAGPPSSRSVTAEPPRESANSAGDANLPVIADAVGAVDALARYFQTNDRLTRAGFFELIRKSQSISSR